MSDRSVCRLTIQTAVAYHPAEAGLYKRSCLRAPGVGPGRYPHPHDAARRRAACPPRTEGSTHRTFAVRCPCGPPPMSRCPGSNAVAAVITNMNVDLRTKLPFITRLPATRGGPHVSARRRPGSHSGWSFSSRDSVMASSRDSVMARVM